MPAAQQSILDQAFRRFNRAALSVFDFLEAFGYLMTLRGAPDMDRIIKRGLITAAVVAYARPFVAASKSSNKAASQLAGSPERAFSANRRQLHIKLIGLRHEICAHSAYERQPVAWMGGTATGFMYSQFPFDIVGQDLDLATWQDMCEELRNHCHKLLTEVNAKIVTYGGTSPGLPPIQH